MPPPCTMASCRSPREAHKGWSMRATVAATCDMAVILGHTQEAALPRDWPPGTQSRQRVPDHGALVGDGGPAELPFEGLADRLRQPGAAADIEAVGIRVLGEG